MSDIFPVFEPYPTAAHNLRFASKDEVSELMTKDEFKACLSEAEKALAQTPEMLPVLKKAGVVDAGGKGLIIIWRAMLEVFCGGKAVTDEKDVEALCEKCAGFVDRLLGTGADERIFRGRVKNIYDYIDLLTYISNGITAFTRQRTPKNNPYYNKKRKRK